MTSPDTDVINLCEAEDIIPEMARGCATHKPKKAKIGTTKDTVHDLANTPTGSTKRKRTLSEKVSVLGSRAPKLCWMEVVSMIQSLLTRIAPHYAVEGTYWSMAHNIRHSFLLSVQTMHPANC